MLNRILAALFVIAAGASHALNVSEPPPPGFGADYWHIGTLDVGPNFISGGLNGICVVGDCNAAPDGPSGNSQDSIMFTVAPGTTLQSLTVDGRGANGPAGFSASVELQFHNETIAFMLAIPANTVSTNLLSSPLRTGEYRLSVFGQSSSAAGFFSTPYTLSLDVSPVPEPASAVLLLCGGLMLAAYYRGFASR